MLFEGIQPMVATGTQLGPYRILAPLGAGGMGEVYRAKDLRLNREVALKVLPEQFVRSPDRLARFEREAKALAALSHPNVLAIYDVGADESIPFVVMELLTGETLRERIARSPLPWSEAIEIGNSVAEGLAAAHAKGIVHRDLKPENVFLTEDGRVKVLDFGLACAEAGPDEGSPTPDTGPYLPAITESGVLLGTIAYLSPEQARGERVEARSDVFAFGCVLYEMLAGKRAFGRGTRAGTIAAILHEEPPALAGPGQEIPSELERLIRHCLEKNPRKRFQSARDLAFALRSIVPDPSRAKSSAPFSLSRRRVLFWAAAFLGACGLAAALLAAFLGGRREDSGAKKDDRLAGPIQSVAVLPWVNETGDARLDYQSNGLPEALSNSLTALRSLKVKPFSTTSKYKEHKEQSPEMVGREQNVQAVLTGRLAQEADQLLISVQLVDARDGSLIWGKRYLQKPEELPTVLVDILRQVADNLGTRLTGDEEQHLVKRPTRNGVALDHYLNGLYNFNQFDLEHLLTAIGHFNNALKEDQGYADAYVGLANAYYGLSNNFWPPNQAIPRAKIALDQALRIDGELGEAYALRGYIKAIYDWKWAGAERDLKRAVELLPRSAIVHTYYGAYLGYVGRFDEASKENAEALKLDGTSPFVVAYTSFWSLYFEGRFDEVIERLEKARKTENSFLYEGFLGLAYEQKGDYPSAIDAFKRTIKLSECPEALTQLAHVYAVAGREEEARKELGTLMDLSKRQYVPAYDIGLIHLGLGDYDEAFEWLNKAADEHSEWFAAVNVDPRLKPVRADPRFMALLRKAKLAP